MFEFVRNHKKWMQVMLALLIVPSFIGVAVSGYSNGGASAGEVANVGGKKITQAEFDDALRRYIDSRRAQLGDNFDIKQIDTPETRQLVLDKLIENAAIDAEIRTSHMGVGDVALAKSIMEDRTFANPSGAFDKERYNFLLKQAGLTAGGYDAQLRSSMLRNQMTSAIPGTAFVPRTLAARLSDIAAQEREVQEVVFKASDYAAKVTVTDDMLKAYYTKNAALFQAPEQAKVEYLVLDAASVEGTIAISEADARKVYDADNKKFSTPGTRTVSHILIAKKDGDKARADAVLAEVRTAPGSFAAVAKAKSDDTASAELGGSLGVVKEGDDAFPPELVSAAFKLKEGDVELVQSSFGYHIVTVTKVEPSSVKPFEAVKAEIMAELKKPLMSKKYADLAEQFNNTVYEQSDSLKPAADKLKLEIKTIDGLQRNAKPGSSTLPVYSPKFLRAIFADDAIKNKRNTEAIEVAPATLVAGRVVSYKPAALRPLAEVADAIRERVIAEEASKLAKQAGEAKLAAGKAGTDAEGYGPARTVSRGKQSEISPAAMGELLKADVAKLPAYVGVNLPGAGYAVYRINKVTQPTDIEPMRRDMEREQFNGVAGQLEWVAYLAALKTKSEFKVNPKVLTSKTSTDAQ